jgi:DNA-binding response OmpR family regulator
VQLRVLIAEDDPNTRAALAEVLGGDGHRVTAAADGRHALFYLDRQAFDLACLDVMMPGVNGYDLCRHIRTRNAAMPILFITAKGEEIDKVVGLELGADDYIVKPFGVQEVLARIRAIARRCIQQPGADAAASCINGDDFQMDDLRILPKSLRALRGDQTIELTPRELKLLQILWRKCGQVVSRGELGRAGWEQGNLPGSRTLDQTISQLRKRIEVDPHCPRIIQTVYGVGYRYDG